MLEYFANWWEKSARHHPTLIRFGVLVAAQSINIYNFNIKTKMFEERFDVVFNNYVETETFRLPLSVKELRLFCLNVCRSLMDEYFAWQ